jgi:hypothetical protein
VAAAVKREREEAWDAYLIGSAPGMEPQTPATRYVHRKIAKFVQRGLTRPVVCTSENHNPEWKQPVRRIQVYDVPAKPGREGPYWVYWCARCIKIHWIERAIAMKESQALAQAAPAA